VSSEPRKALYDIAAAEYGREVDSAGALGTRAAAQLGFCGVVLALSATLGRDGLNRDLGSMGRPLAAYALIAGIVVIVASAVLAALVLTPRLRGRINPAVLRELRSAETAEDHIYDRLSKSMITRLDEEAAKNDHRGRLLRWSSIGILLGAALLAVQATVVATTLTHEPCATTRTIETTRTTTTGPPTTTSLRTPTTTVVTTSSMVCAKATTTTSKSASP
jgi:hypothetical protein